MSPLSPYLNVDPRYLVQVCIALLRSQTNFNKDYTEDLMSVSVINYSYIVVPQDTDEFILPTGASKTRGRFELAFFTIGGCCITGETSFLTHPYTHCQYLFSEPLVLACAICLLPPPPSLTLQVLRSAR